MHSGNKSENCGNEENEKVLDFFSFVDFHKAERIFERVERGCLVGDKNFSVYVFMRDESIRNYLIKIVLISYNLSLDEGSFDKSFLLSFSGPIK